MLPECMSKVQVCCLLWTCVGTVFVSPKFGRQGKCVNFSERGF